MERNMDGDKGTVCITGGTGFIASWLTKRLLEQGYSVHATVRPDPEKKRDLSFLTNLPGASAKLKIFTADLNDPDSFAAAIEGCTGVLHVATPVDFASREPEEVKNQRAINGTIGILKSCLKTKTVKRVIYASSSSTVEFDARKLDVVDESCWSDIDDIRQKITPHGFASYMISKTVTEKAALQFAEENGIDLVSIIFPFTVGSFICPKFPTSIRTFLSLILGDVDEYVHLLKMNLVHVEDVTRAHIFLLENPVPKGRYICSSHIVTLQQISEHLSAKYPEYPIPTADFLAQIKGYTVPDMSTKKLLETGFEYKYGLDEIFRDGIQCCKANGYI